MEELGKTINELIKSGAPLAMWAIIGYYVSGIFTNLLIFFGVIAGMSVVKHVVTAVAKYNIAASISEACQRSNVKPETLQAILEGVMKARISYSLFERKGSSRE